MMWKNDVKYFKFDTLDLVDLKRYGNYRADAKKTESNWPWNNKRKRSTGGRYTFWLIALFL